MKKILLATSILSGFAGMAAAEITLSGDARMGVVNMGTFDGASGEYEQETMFNSRVRATITLSGETDSGLSFGGSFGVHNAGDAASGKSGSVYISGVFGKIAVGDVDTAAQAMVGQVSGVGYTGNGDWNEITYIGQSTEAALWTYSMGDLTIAASLGQQGELQGTDYWGYYTYDHDDDSYAIGASYKLGNYTLSAAAEHGNKLVKPQGYKSYSYEYTAYSSYSSEEALLQDSLTVGLDAAFGDLTVKVRAGTLSGEAYDDDGAIDGSQGAMSVSYKMDALTLNAFYAESIIDFYNSYTWRTSRSGVGASYDLGGGATAAVGYSDLTNTLYGPSYEWDDRRWDAGVNFSF